MLVLNQNSSFALPLITTCSYNLNENEDDEKIKLFLSFNDIPSSSILAFLRAGWHGPQRRIEQKTSRMKTQNYIE
jgi:hypothetical protein